MSNHTCPHPNCARNIAPASCPHRFAARSTPQYIYLESGADAATDPYSDSFYKRYNAALNAPADSSRPSSSSCVKTCAKRKCKRHAEKKENQSDSRIVTQRSLISERPSQLSRSTNEQRIDPKPKLDPTSIKQLKKDMELIKQQLVAINANRNEALDVTNELQKRHQLLAAKSKRQETEIERLKAENRQLVETIGPTPALAVNNLQMRCSELSNKSVLQQGEIDCLKKKNDTLEKTIKEHSMDSSTRDSLMDTKQNLDECEKKLSKIYNELLNSSKDELLKTKSLLNEKDKEVCCFQKQAKKCKENEIKLREANRVLMEKIVKLEQNYADTRESLNKIQTDWRSRESEMKNMQGHYVKQLEDKSQRLDELSLAVDSLQMHICECRATAKDAEAVKNQYQDLLSSHNSILKELDKSEELLKDRTRQMEIAQTNEAQLKNEFQSVKKFNEELINVIKTKDFSIAELHSINQQKEKYIENVRGELAHKDRKIKNQVKSEARYKAQIAQLLKEVATLRSCPYVCSTGHQHAIGQKAADCNRCNDSISAEISGNSCNSDMTQELQHLINALYEEIDKTMNKDDQIEKQYQNINCLECKLSEKERDLSKMRNELKILNGKYHKACNQNTELQGKLKEMQPAESTTVESNESTTSECDCGTWTEDKSF